ncbi:MAG: parallel beta-helix domain-containing protein [Fuerstiella sp.]
MCIFFASVAAEVTADDLAPSVVAIQPGPAAQFQLQAALINAVPGDVIDLAAGTYHFDSELNVVCDNVTIRGRGHQQTVLSFRNQNVGSNGIVATGNAFVIQDLAVEDTVGNAIKVLGARDVTFRRVRVEWTDGPKSTNGAYGIYPVECSNVLIEECLSIAASDAGIYVGQSQDVVVKGCMARQNVAGIEIENTLRADVYDNHVTDNTGGLLVFDLPGLNLTNGGQIRLFRNRIEANNHSNFAPRGTMVADVPSGTGVMVMATDHVEIFDNDLRDNQTSNVLVVSFLITERKINDAGYDPYPEAFSIHDNRFSGGGTRPSGAIGTLLAPVVGLPFPDIFYDGLTDAAKLVDGRLPPELRSRIADNGDATFANVNIGDFSPANVFSGRYQIDRDITSLGADRPALKPVTLTPHQPPSGGGNPAVTVYRKAPRRLSEWGLFAEVDGRYVPADDLVSYELNTPLFSDYTAKHRFVRLPAGGHATWDDEEAFGFPVGTVIAKTFAYPDTSRDRTPDERFLETRLEVHEASGWYGYSYIWNDQQTDADLQLGGGAVDVSWTDSDGDVHHNKYQVPNANQCLSCHSRDGKFVPLGPTARNLNRPAADNDTENQLTSWVRHGILQGAPAADERPVLAAFDDPDSGSVDARARAWLEVNCAHCHNPLGSARTSGLDLRTVQTDAAKYGVFKSPVAAGKGSGGRRYDIVPGKPDESILLYRLETEEAGARMPNLARNLVHAESVALIREWIREMPE